MPSNEMIEIKIAGSDILPENVKASDIADILNSVEDMIEAVVFRDNPQVSREKVIVGLVNIKPGSVSLQFRSQIPEEVFPAYEKIAKAVSTNDYTIIPSSAIQALQSISSFVKKRNCNAMFIAINGKDEILAEITPDTEIKRIPPLTGDTVLFGQIIRVGGRTPKAMLETIDGQTIYCDVHKDIAQRLGEKLYLSVGLYGKAQWDSESLEIEEFMIKDLLDYEQISITHAFTQLADLTREYYADLKNVDEYITDIRNKVEI